MKRFFPALVFALVLFATTSAWAGDFEVPKFKPTEVKVYAKATQDAVDPQIKIINPEPAWKITKGQGVKLYVADTWIDLSHPEFAGLKTRFKSFTGQAPGKEQEHATHVASIACGRGSVDGIAPQIDELIGLEVLDNTGSGSFDWLADAITWTITDAAGKPAVFNASLGSGANPGIDPNTFDPKLRKAIQDGIKAGIVFVFAAGNDNSKTPPNSVGFPARFAELSEPLASLVIVAACDVNRRIASFSSVGPATRVTTTGVDVLGALPNGRYGRWPGTSMASPIAAGLACLWLSNNQDVPAPERQKQFAEALRKSCSFPDQRHPARGFGLPDAGKLIVARQPVPPTPPVPQPPTPPSNTFTGTVTYTYQDGKVVSVKVVEQPNAPAAIPVAASNGYPAARAAVESGKRIVLHVGIPGGEYNTPNLEGVAPGIYECAMENGRPLMRLRDAVSEVRGTIADGVRPVAQPIYQGIGNLPVFGGGCPGGVCPTPLLRR